MRDDQRTTSFGYWVRLRRRSLDLTQAELADRIGCATVTISKIEQDRRRPSRQVAELLADSLGVAEEDRTRFINMGRGRLADQLVSVPNVPIDSLVLVAQHEEKYEAAIARAERLLNADPLRESTYHWLIRLHIMRGDRAAALSVYHTCAARLKDELGAEPGPEVQSTYARLLGMETTPVLHLPEVRAPRAPLLVGREKAWHVLRGAWQKAVDGNLHFCLIGGEAGIGKTRLAQELLVWVQEQGFPAAYTRAYEMAGSLIYTPIIDWLHSEPLQAAFWTLDGIWLSEIARLVPELLVERPEIPRPEPMQERWQRQRLFQALAQLFFSSRQPLLLILDDIQWCDADTMLWLHYLVEETAKLRRQDVRHTAPAILVVITARNEEIHESNGSRTLLPTLAQTDTLTRIDLLPLTQLQTAQLASHVCSRTPDAESAADLFAYTDGNPFYIVETLTNMEWEQAVKRSGPQSAPKLPLAEIGTLPPKVYTLIRSQLGQLTEEARQIADFGAAIGTSFGFELLRFASRLDENQLMVALDELWRRGVVRERENRQYDFSHDRVRDVTYAEINPVRRAFLHRAIAGALVSLHEGDIDAVVGQLSFQYERAGQTGQAVDHYLRAAHRSHALSAYETSLQYLDKALELIGQLPSSSERTRQKIEAWTTKARILVVTHGWTHPERRDALEQAYRLAEGEQFEPQLFYVVQDLRAYYGNTGNYRANLRLARQGLALAERLQEPVILAEAYSSMASCHLRRGEYTESLAHCRKVERIAGISETDWKPMIARFPLVEALWACGYPDQALATATGLLPDVDRFGEPFSQVHAREFLLYFYEHLGALEKLAGLIAEMDVLCGQYGFPNYALAAGVFAGWLTAERGEVTDGLRQITAGLEGLDEIGDRLNRPYQLWLLAKAQAKAGAVAGAMHTLDVADRIADQTESRAWKTELLRLSGDLLVKTDRLSADAESFYHQALQLARRQGAHSLELRAATSLARFWQGQRKFDDAYRVLADVYGWFTEGFQTADLREANTLLETMELEL